MARHGLHINDSLPLDDGVTVRLSPARARARASLDITVPSIPSAEAFGFEAPPVEAIADGATVVTRAKQDGDERIVDQATRSPSVERRWMEEEALILTWAGSGGFVGALFAGRVGGVVGFFIAGMYAAMKVARGG